MRSEAVAVALPTVLGLGLALWPVRVPAAELVLRDISAGIELRTAAYDFSVDGPTDDSSGSDAFDSSLALRFASVYSLAGTGRRHGPLLGGGILLEQQSFSGGGELTTIGLQLAGGYGWALNDRVQLAAMPYVGYGMSTLALDDRSQFSAVEGDGTSFVYGLRVDCHYAINRRWSLAAGLGYGWTTTEIAAADVDITFEQAALHMGLALTWRWDITPPLLDP
ncbi:MAG: outer membrane beta-barrel protein [Planctomycetota bacterium]